MSPIITTLIQGTESAYQFRFSWYYVGFLSTALASFSNLLEFENLKEGIFSVVNPVAVELPTCLSSVTSAWNKPIGNWIKLSIFYPLLEVGKVKFGHISANSYFGLDPRLSYRFIILMITYILSSLLHGLDIRIFNILFLLGFYTYVQYSFRSRLALIFDKSCIAPKNSKYRETLSKSVGFVQNFLTTVFQIGFFIINWLHLQYLGCIMMDDHGEDWEPSNEGYRDLIYALWKGMEFFSLKISLGMFLTYLFIR